MGLPIAYELLGFMLYNKEIKIIECNDFLSFILRSIAVEKHNINSLGCLGMAYESGRGIP